MAVQILHILNCVNVPENTELGIAQKITFQTIRKALQYTKQKDSIQLIATVYDEDLPVVADFFSDSYLLKRSMQDVLPAGNGKKLPFIADILHAAKDFECDFVLYTNLDIALMPFFYDTLFTYIDKGHDAVVINRRRINGSYSKSEELPLMYSELGDSHPGFDSFLIKKELISKFILEDICIGIPFLEGALVHNIAAFSENPLYVMDAHLTFHIGREVLPPVHKAYYQHNRTVFFNQIQPKIKHLYRLKKFPYSQTRFPLRMFKWGLNPSIFTRNYIELERRNFVGKIRYILNEFRWRFLQK